ncbi:MAG: tryptophan synthase subunit alpha [Capsulimonadaceae bacterium]|nr:tryptophan synthase subunit alpha [Capsulimonadaceae bacterium]
MPNRLDATFAALKARREAALVTYVAAGDPFPTVEKTARVVLALAEAGADVVELGIPYSDPMADGPTIQAATQRALDAGVNPPFVFDVVRRVRRESQTPIVLMGYYNNVLRIGLARFAQEMADAGADGVILSDLPPEEADPWKTEADARKIATIFLLAPTSTPERIDAVVSDMNSGFVYCVSRTGVTGVQRDVPEDLHRLVTSIKNKTNLPVCVGFGISTREHVKQVSSISDGVVIGSRLVEALRSNAGSAEWETTIRKMVSEWKSGTTTKENHV